VLLPQSAGPQLVYRDRRFWDGEKKGKDGLAFVVSHPSQKKGRMGHPGLWLGWEDKDFGWVIRHEGKLRVSGRYRAGFQPFVVSFGPETQPVGLGWYSVAPLALEGLPGFAQERLPEFARRLLFRTSGDCSSFLFMLLHCTQSWLVRGWFRGWFSGLRWCGWRTSGGGFRFRRASRGSGGRGVRGRRGLLRCGNGS